MSISSNAKSAPYLALRKSGKNAVSISFHAAGFRGGYEEYVVAANNLLIPTLAGYNARYKTKLKAKIQSREELLFPFPPQSRECFDNFIRAANNKILHPLDWQRLYRLARVCHSTTRIPPGEEEFARLLLEAGFSEEYSWKISDTFQHLLGVLSAPRSF